MKNKRLSSISFRKCCICCTPFGRSYTRLFGRTLQRAFGYSEAVYVHLSRLSSGCVRAFTRPGVRANGRHIRVAQGICVSLFGRVHLDCLSLCSQHPCNGCIHASERRRRGGEHHYSRTVRLAVAERLVFAHFRQQGSGHDREVVELDSCPCEWPWWSRESVLVSHRLVASIAFLECSLDRWT